jgi:HTH-type transcriptional regulator/antitoxin MqsA
MTNLNKQCDICGEGQLHTTVETNTVTYKETTKNLPLYGSTCNCCGSEQASAADSRMNKRAMQAFKKEVDELLSNAEIVAIRVKYGLSQKQAANIFGGGPVAFSKYESGDVTQSEPMDKLLRVCRENLDSFIWLANRANEFDVVNSLMNRGFVGFGSFDRVKKTSHFHMEEGFKFLDDTYPAAANSESYCDNQFLEVY